jgi:hypothetical protein
MKNTGKPEGTLVRADYHKSTTNLRNVPISIPTRVKPSKRSKKSKIAYAAT